MKKTFLADRLLQWYALHKRDLPWRHQSNPYFIWLSEVLLQQTRVQQGLPYYEKFVETFPNVQALAAADEKEVLRLWQGLGYYSRARNLHLAAKHIAGALQGKIPSSYAELIKLKGVGAYTAAAIASFAFGEKVAVVDGNVYRVLSRVYGIETDIASGAGAREFSDLAHSLLPLVRSSDYNQAIMEFGALHCTPAHPKCPTCPLSEICIANERGLQTFLPVKIKKGKKKLRYFNYLVFQYEGGLLLHKRSKGDIWTGLYEFYLLEKEVLVPLPELAKTDHALTDHLTVITVSRDYKHLLTHQTIFSRFTVVEIREKRALDLIVRKYDLQPFTLEQIRDLPKPVLIIKFLDDYVFS